jgi:hypothetical protein
MKIIMFLVNETLFNFAIIRARVNEKLKNLTIQLRISFIFNYLK